MSRHADRTCRIAQNPDALLLDVIEGTAFGQHEKVSQDVIQVTFRRAFRCWSQ
ncbi:hypothetical protein F7725_019648 [Dissostichus mawsoni]|uniref:Uncharacterized protein n=1 Tax=Dissostichus mawsoni TaxID=36200 RepID=A0A7J5YME9_DISMA|nr:hypothetical protein F7725_019648 [Dissostichus mawsoni]